MIVFYSVAIPIVGLILLCWIAAIYEARHKSD